MTRLALALEKTDHVRVSTNGDLGCRVFDIVAAGERERRLLANVWSMLIPRSAVRVEPAPKGGLRYLHATKGWRTLSKRRVAMLAQ